MFNALVSLDAVRDSRVLDLYAGSGALGIEALSRGASSCVFIDLDRAARRAIDTNLATTGYADRSTVVGRDVASWLQESVATADPVRGGFDLVLLDPPYATDESQWTVLFDALAVLAAGGVVVAESARSIACPDGWDAQREKRYGGTLVTILLPPVRPESA